MNPDRPKLLRGHTAPVLPYAAQLHEISPDDGDSTQSRASLQLDPSVLSAMHRMSLGNNNRGTFPTDYRADGQTSGTPSFSSYSNTSMQSAENKVNSLQATTKPGSRTNHTTTTKASQVSHMFSNSPSATPLHPYHSGSNSLGQQTSAIPMRLQSAPAATAYFSPYILKSMGGAQQPLIEFSVDHIGNTHVLLARLGRGFSNECLTVAARKGNILWIVADRWDREVDSKYEWQIQFDRDADLTKVHANFDNGLLRITVRRRVS